LGSVRGSRDVGEQRGTGATAASVHTQRCDIQTHGVIGVLDGRVARIEHGSDEFHGGLSFVSRA
jgi:hypothetical protein